MNLALISPLFCLCSFVPVIVLSFFSRTVPSVRLAVVGIAVNVPIPGLKAAETPFEI